MAYQLMYSFSVKWVGAGAPPTGAGSTLRLNATPGGQCSQTFTSDDITTLTNAAAADMVTQLTANTLAITNFSLGS